jgi:GTP cyclohydrolase II
MQTTPALRLHKVAEADFPTRFGHFSIHGFEGAFEDRVDEAVVLAMGDLEHGERAPLVRIHSQCLTGDVFGSLRCDCRLQLELAMERIVAEGAGILLYEQQEGRGIGLMAKLKAYELQDHGLDTVEANVKLGFAADCRGYELPAEVLKLLGVSAVRLITNNPDKVAALQAAGIQVVERISAEVVPQDTFAGYLKTKHEKMGHITDAVVSK